jgi:hypothetical protein
VFLGIYIRMATSIQKKIQENLGLAKDADVNRVSA